MCRARMNCQNAAAPTSIRTWAGTRRTRRASRRRPRPASSDRCSASRSTGSTLSVPRAAARISSSRRSTTEASRSSLNSRQPLDLVALGLRIDAQDVRHLERVLDELVDADDDVLLDAVALVVAERRLLDLVLHEVDRLDRAAELVDLGDQLLGAELDLVGQRLDEVGAGERIDRVGARPTRTR